MKNIIIKKATHVNVIQRGTFLQSKYPAEELLIIQIED